MISGFAAPILIAFVAPPVGIMRIRKLFTVKSNVERVFERTIRQTAYRARHQELLTGPQDTCLKGKIVDQAEGQRQ